MPQPSPSNAKRTTVAPASTTQRGLALVVVLWAAVLLSLMAAAATSLSRTDVNIARNMTDGVQVELAADAALYTALYGVIDADQLVWKPDGAVYGWMIDGVEVRVQVEDEMGRIDLNAAHPLLLKSLLSVSGVEPDLAARLADQITDFRDPDSDTSPQGAEDDAYADAGRPLGAKDAPLATVDELGRVLEMTPEILGRIRGAVTVHSRRAWPMTTSSSPLTIAATEGRPLSNPPQDPVLIAPDLLLGETPTLLLAAPPGREDIYSEILRIQSEARTPEGAFFAREAIVAIEYAENTPFTMLSWRRGERALFPTTD